MTARDESRPPFELVDDSPDPSRPSLRERVRGYFRDLHERMFAFRHEPVPEGPPSYQAVGYCMKAVGWIVLVGVAWTLLAVVTAWVGLAVFMTLFVGFFGSLAAGPWFLVGLIAFLLLILVLLVVVVGAYVMVASLTVIPVAKTYRLWVRRKEGARGRTAGVGAIVAAVGILILWGLLIGSASEPFIRGAGLQLVRVLVGGGLVGLGGVMVVLPWTAATRAFFETSSAEDDPPVENRPAGSDSGPGTGQTDESRASAEAFDTSRGSGPQEPREQTVCYRCPGCGTVYALPEDPPAGTRCPSCRE